eukprot:TRINITY_DN478_c0_g1_i1.p2 TRINITY_DN478_c0_g1~~TRINITY_DN478_c0_g1_i1.p2  ORF type:complete len:351 (+),score=104.15 TRINITY_DN478_c0_g1_i1:104-1054(+)
MDLWNIIFWIFAGYGIVSVTLYLAPLIIAWLFFKPQNLKKKYDAKWALVTGGSSGLGKALSEKLAQQGLNVVIAALGDDLLKNTTAELQAKYPECEFRAVPCDFNTSDLKGGNDYMKVIKEATKDIDVQIIFSNAGYIVMRGFMKTPIERWLANMECNATSHLRIVHHFMTNMMEKKLRGCVVFTSSTISFLPAPANSLYAATKAFLVGLGSSIAMDGFSYGIDVMVANMGPMRTRFWEGKKILDVAKPFLLVESTPEDAADVMLSNVGRFWIRDHSALNAGLRLLVRVVDTNLLVGIQAAIKGYLPDARKNPELF